MLFYFIKRVSLCFKFLASLGIFKSDFVALREVSAELILNKCEKEFIWSELLNSFSSGEQQKKYI